MEIQEFSKELKEKSKLINIELKDSQIEKFYNYMNLLLEWNEKINLTAITEPKEVILKHFVDSATIIKYIEDYQCIQKVYELNRKHYLLIINHIHLHDETIGTFIFLEDIDEYNYS